MAKWNVVAEAKVVVVLLSDFPPHQNQRSWGDVIAQQRGARRHGNEDAVKDPTIPDHTCQNRAVRSGGIYRRPSLILHVITCMAIRGIDEQKHP